MEFLSKIGKKIKEMRIEQGLGQEELAGRVSISPTSLRQIEKGRQNLTVETLRKIVEEGLHSDVAAFFALLNYNEEDSEEDSEAESWSLYEAQVRKSMYPPHLSHYQISSLLEFILYLPLMDPSLLVEMLGRIQGNVIGREDYIVGKINYLVNQIAAGPAKQFADLEVQAMCLYGHGQDPKPLSEEETELYNAYTSKLDNLENIMRHVDHLLSAISAVKVDAQINGIPTSDSL